MNAWTQDVDVNEKAGYDVDNTPIANGLLSEMGIHCETYL